MTMSENKYQDLIQSYNVETDDNAVTAAVDSLLARHKAENHNREVYCQLLNSIDLTTLRSTDTPSGVANFVERVNSFESDYPDLPNVAAICVYPNFAQVVRTVLEVSDVDVCCVSGCFPSSQSFSEVKIAETALAVAGGADEIDIVLNLGNFLDGDYEEVCDEVSEQKCACRDARLKVILETGALKTAANIAAASILAMNSGADFIKTSTGKEYPGASLFAAYVMCCCIKEYHRKTGRKVGFKCAGGVRSTDEAVAYYTIVKEVLGQEWLNNDSFRIGASSLANAVLGDILGQEVKYF